jgi:hypothetical protein
MALDDEPGDSPLPESILGDASNLDESGANFEQSSPGLDGHEDVIVGGRPPTRAEPRVQADEEAEREESPGAPRKEELAASDQQEVISGAAPISGGDSVAPEERNGRQALQREQPLESRDKEEVQGSDNSEDGDPRSTLQESAEEEDSAAVRGIRDKNDPGACPKQGEVVEERESSGDRGVGGDAQVPVANKYTKQANADRAPQSPGTAVTRETDQSPGKQVSAEAGRPEEARAEGGIIGAGASSTSEDEHSSGPAAGDDADKAGPDSTTLITPDGKMRTSKGSPSKYRGLSRAVPQPGVAGPRPGRPAGEDPTERERSLPIEVRLRFDRGGSFSVSLIAKRSVGLPEDLTLAAPTGEVNLRAMQDEWYQDVVPDDIASVLRTGTVWTHEDTHGRSTWRLSGRDLYVLADRTDISGYVSQPCLELSRDHVVLCTESLRSRVEETILETGGQAKTILDHSFGAPPGWLVFRHVVPSQAVSPAEDADIFNALRPLPRIEISLERGIRVGNANWLAGHPPTIRVYGDAEHASEVRIDGHIAERDVDNTYRVPGWDAVGSHSVWCAGTSKSYSIVPFDGTSEAWDAYAFPVGNDAAKRLSVCGPIVRVAALGRASSESIAVPGKNAVLLGPEPGQIVIATKASPLPGAPCIASPNFRPIWALPRDPLRCDKETNRILFVGVSEVSVASQKQGGEQHRSAEAKVARWCRVILDSSRKGLTTDPDSASMRALWLSYKRFARQIWRARQ